MKDFKTSKTATHIKSFLGIVGYYRKFIRKFSKIAKPLTDLTIKDTQFHWTDKQQLAFDTLKQKLCEAPLLQYPDFEHPCCYISRTLNPPEKNYSTTEKEL